ncbi:MAG: hypothetical protein ACFE9N_03610 [Promethearchaeota archaeon]
MKPKKLGLLIILSSLIFPWIFISSSRAEIEWQVNEGDKFTWIVQASNETLGFLPVNSRYEMTITAIKSVADTTELYVNLSVYNSDTELTTKILTNETFSFFNSATNTTTLYTYITDHCFLIPPAYVDGFAEGLKNFYSGFFNITDDLTVSGVYSYFGWIEATNLLYNWLFNANYIADNLVVAFLNTPSIFEYWLVLQIPTTPTISIGYYFWVFLGIAAISLLYINRRKIQLKIKDLK